MVTISKLSRRLVAFLLVWITGSLIVSFSVTHDDQEMLDTGESRSLLLDEQEHEMNTSSTDTDRGLQPQVQVPSPRMLIHQPDRKIHNRVDSSKHHIQTENKWHYFRKRGSPLPKKNELPADFVSPAAGRATMCAVRTQHGCSVQPCQQQQDTTTSMATASGSNDTIPVAPADWHYGHGLVHRDNDLRGTTMMTSGQAKVGSGCAKSVKYKFVYIHVLKSAGMTIKAFLKRALCGGSTGNVTPCFESDNDNDEHSEHSEPAEPLLEIVNCAAAMQEHPDYFVWSFVRNPFSRLYSGYSMADDFRHRGGRQQGHEHDMPAFTFSDFGQASQTARSRMTSASNAHFLPQTNFLFSRSSCPVFDFLGRLEHLDEDLATVLSIVGSPELTDYVRANNGTIHHERNTAYGSSKSLTELHGDLRNAYAANSVQAAAAVEYARDFKLLGYDPNLIPTTTSATK